MGALVINSNASLVFLGHTTRDLCGEDQGETGQNISRFQVWCVTVRDAHNAGIYVGLSQETVEGERRRTPLPPPSTTFSRHAETTRTV